MDQSLSKKKYETLLRRVGDLPALPDMVNKIIAKLNRPNVPASDIARLISYDPGLTTKFLRIVNSAAYGFYSQISSVQHAIMILGFGMVRGVVLSASIFKMFENKTYAGLDPETFWRHSIGTAVASRLIANHRRIAYSDDAFSAGLLHNIGQMIMDYYFNQEYKLVLDQAKVEGIALYDSAFAELERQILGFDHTEVGQQLAQKWRLPNTFAEVIRFHHHPEEAKDAVDLVYVVALASIFSTFIFFNYGVFNKEAVPKVMFTHFNATPDSPEVLEILYEKVVAEMEGIDDLLVSLKH